MGGIYFFMRTVLNALVKCVFSIIFIGVHFVFKVLKADSSTQDKETISINQKVPESEEDGPETTPMPPIVTADPHVSLLGPLPHYYGSTTVPKANSKSKYV